MKTVDQMDADALARVREAMSSYESDMPLTIYEWVQTKCGIGSDLARRFMAELGHRDPDYGRMSSMRDLIAREAMAAILSGRDKFLVDVGADNVATWAYRIADLMMEERDKSSKAEAAQ